MLVQLMFLVKVNWIEGQLLQKMQQLNLRMVIERITCIFFTIMV